MRKLFIITLTVILVVGMTGIGYAGLEDSNAEKGLSASPAFEEDTDHESDGHFTHQNGAPRFSTEKGHIAIDAEEPGLNSDENSAVSEHHHDNKDGSVIDTSK
ncbi:hypothetical protein C7954_13233 [Halanaerobium congolense]|uniref:Uncharacterized protein n=1 Tax=Halanaerobium congolense TaxID=54121 RepID=A0A4R8GFY4_9FIRM|nr:hypothetical protein [Halanaerobium congolense]TDX39364.1 hypothetical protein C7954_13233 [Halanaerobium congolense]